MLSARTFVVAAFTASACATQAAPPQHAGTCVSGAPDRRFREMTWHEYYSQVSERAWRSGATVIWVNPPNVRTMAAREVRPSACR